MALNKGGRTTGELQQMLILMAKQVTEHSSRVREAIALLKTGHPKRALAILELLEHQRAERAWEERNPAQ